ncbi:unnamed protein product, partial [Linum tenue]
DLLTLEDFCEKRRVHWFLPPAFGVSKVGGRVFAYSEETLKTMYGAEEFSDCEKIFAPVLVDKHFFLSVFDLNQKVIQILDSFPNYLDPIVMEEKVKQIANELDSLFYVEIIRRYACDMLVSFTVEIVVNALRQQNGFDCGLFVLKLMRSGGSLDDCSRGMRKRFDSEEERIELALFMLNNKDNEVGDEIYRKLVGQSQSG